MKNGTLPIRDVKWHYGDEDDDDYDDSGYYEDYNDDGSGFDTREMGLNFVVHGFNEMEFISDNDKTIVNEAKDTANRILAEYRIMLAKLSTIAERAYKDLSRFYDSISVVDSEISEYLTDRYYSFLEAKEADIEERLVARLYEKYVDSLNEQLETRHWAAMLKDYLTIETGGLMKKIIKECFSYTHAIDISDPRISHYLSRMCEDMSEINEFFNYFLEVAILQSKVRSDIKIIRRPKTEEKVENEDKHEPDEMIALPTSELMKFRGEALRVLQMPVGTLAVFHDNEMTALVDKDDNPLEFTTADDRKRSIAAKAAAEAAAKAEEGKAEG